jgi:ABC-2 type transport system permease protein
MRAVAAGAQLEFRIMRANPDALMPLVTAPLFAIIFLMIVRNSGRHDLEADALMAPVLMTLWWLALQHAGAIISGDRWQALLEPAMASPTGLGGVLLGRICFLMVMGLFSFVEVWAVGTLLFGVELSVEHPVALLLTLAVSAFATAGTAVAFAAIFVLTRNAHMFANPLSFPFYLLGGVLVPVALLPSWIQPISSAIYMSWCADLLRASFRAQPVDGLAFRLGMVVVIGTTSFAVGRTVLTVVLRRMRMRGDAATA